MKFMSRTRMFRSPPPDLAPPLFGNRQQASNTKNTGSLSHNNNDQEAPGGRQSATTNQNSRSHSFSNAEGPLHAAAFAAQQSSRASAQPVISGAFQPIPGSGTANAFVGPPQTTQPVMSGAFQPNLGPGAASQAPNSQQLPGFGFHLGMINKNAHRTTRAWVKCLSRTEVDAMHYSKESSTVSWLRFNTYRQVNPISFIILAWLDQADRLIQRWHKRLSRTGMVRMSHRYVTVASLVGHFRSRNCSEATSGWRQGFVPGTLSGNRHLCPIPNSFSTNVRHNRKLRCEVEKHGRTSLT